MKIVLTRRLPGEETQKLIDHYDEVVVMEEDRPLTETELANVFKDANVVICQLTDPINESTLPKSVFHVISFSVGIDHIDLNYLRKNNISLSHTPNVLTEATADLTWALILNSARKLKDASRFVEDGNFKGFGPELFVGKSISGATLGIVGMGRIGQAVAERALGFKMPILYTSPKEISSKSNLSAKRVSLEELLQNSDFVSLHCPLNASTHHLIGSKELELMRWDATLVNTARGAVVDEKALIAHLERHPEFNYATDVYEFEPRLPAEFLMQKNILALPHIGSADRTTRLKMASVCLEEAIRFAKGEELMYLVK